MNVLVTGGAGFIGSHAVLRLLEDGHGVTVVDDLSRGNAGAIEALRALCGDLHFERGDINDGEMMSSLMRSRRVDLVMHFAALAYVGESVHDPLRYYRINTAGTLTLVEAMRDAGVRRLVFSSSCATYGEPSADQIPIGEGCPQQPVNPYGRSKLHGEQIITDHAEAMRLRGEDFAFALLRYFNVAGSDPQGRIGEDHKPETHLVPICLEAALGQRDAVTIFGTDYPTPDGTCVRDYVHVSDLIDAHVRVMNALRAGDGRRYNVGIGRGYSVREVIEACRRVTGVKFAEKAGERRAGDPPTLYADGRRIEREAGWKPRFVDLDAIIATAWAWRKERPQGYGGA